MRGKGSKPKAPEQAQDRTPAERRAVMTWIQRLKRVFDIDIESCSACGGGVKVITCINNIWGQSKDLVRHELL
jgi:hypothetical protein